MPTSATSTRKPRKIQRLAADGDLHPDFVVLLRAVGFDVADVRFHPDPATVQSDQAVLIWARDEGRILVCHDRHKDRATRKDFYNEIYFRGGKVIEVGGDNSQSPYLALGKVLINREQWQHFFRNRRGGIVAVHKDSCLPKTAKYLYEAITKGLPYMPGPRPRADTYVPKKPRKPRPRPARAGASLFDTATGGAA